jgi:hypothetical protein
MTEWTEIDGKDLEELLVSSRAETARDRSKTMTWPGSPRTPTRTVSRSSKICVKRSLTCPLQVMLKAVDRAGASAGERRYDAGGDTTTIGTRIEDDQLDGGWLPEVPAGSH